MKISTKLKIATALAVASSVWLAVNVHNNKILKRGMPPGYTLQCDATGRYRACHENGLPLFDLNDPSTKLAAIKRSWDQYDYDTKLAQEKWTNCNDR